MKNLFFLFSLLILLMSCNYSINVENESEAKDTIPLELNEDHLSNAGVDEYGMKKYVMAFLKRGPNRSHDSATAAKIQRDHLDNITRMADNGQLVLAGPFLDNGEIRGIYIFNTSTVEEAKKLTETDPAVQAGRLIMELHPWYGSAALIEVNNLHKKFSKKDI